MIRCVSISFTFDSVSSKRIPNITPVAPVMPIINTMNRAPKVSNSMILPNYLTYVLIINDIFTFYNIFQSSHAIWMPVSQNNSLEKPGEDSENISIIKL